MGSVAAFSILLTKDNLLTTFQSPLYAWSQSPASNNDRTPSHHTSSSSSLERSTNPSSQYAASSSNDPYNNRHQYPSHQSLDEREPDEFNAHPGTLSALDSTKASGYQNSLRRPAPPPLSYTTPNAKMMTPSLRQSASFSMGDRSGNAAPPDAETSSVSSKRYSDDANGKNSTPWKKKSGFSNFIGSVLGSPRSNSVKISAPENPVHVTHVGFDNETGQFTVCSDTSLYQISSNPHTVGNRSPQFARMPFEFFVRLRAVGHTFW